MAFSSASSSICLSLFDDDDFHGIGADVAEVRKREKQRDGIERIKKRDQLARHSHPSLVKINLKLQLTKNQNQTSFTLSPLRERESRMSSLP